MCKLYFKYGCVGSSKSANLLMTKYNYENQGMKCLLIKPAVDTRDKLVRSRVGLESPCLLISDTENIINLVDSAYDVVLVDEAQFLSEEQVNQLYFISLSIPVLCYGLMTDFQQHLFEGSKRLVELAENTQEIKTVCSCGRKATVNARYINGMIVKNGDVVAIESDKISYRPMCKHCFLKEVYDDTNLAFRVLSKSGCGC